MKKNDTKTISVERRQRAVASELGLLDRSTTFESNRKRRFVYNLFKDTTCLIDIDEEPPRDVNSEALEVAFMIANSLNAKIPDEIEPMRKGVVDGSDPSAFQRSMLIAYDGSISVDSKDVPISSVFLEEESSGIEASSSEEVTYNVDRLGIPLIEIDTDPVIENPQEAKAVAKSIGLLLRLSGRVQRGIGSIRQDVNISIREGSRVEIKGFQELEKMDLIIENEINRQLKLVELKNELTKRGASVSEYVNITNMIMYTEAKIIKNQVSAGGEILGLKLNGFKGMLGYEINPNRRLGSEIGDYVKSIGVGGIIHSDEDLRTYGITAIEMEAIREGLAIGSNDAFIIIASSKEKCESAMKIAKQRAEMALLGVPSETRGIDPVNYVTKFLRPIPGGSRMYPETDVLPVESKSFAKSINSVKINVESIRARLNDEMKNRQLAEQMLWSQEMPLYNRVIKKTGAKPVVVATVLLEKFKDLERNGIAVEKLSEDVIMYVFGKFKDGEITKLGIEEILKKTPKDEKEVDAVIKNNKLERISGIALKNLADQFKGSKADILKAIMSKYRLNVDGDEVNMILG